MAVVPRRSNPRGDRHLFSSSDDNAMMKQIQATHAPDGREFAVRPLLHLVEDIFHHAMPASGLATIVQHQVLFSATQFLVQVFCCAHLQEYGHFVLLQQGLHHQALLDDLDEKILQNGFYEMLDVLSHTINKISCEVSYTLYRVLMFGKQYYYFAEI